MIFGRYINKYYLKYFALYLFGLFALVLVDYAQLIIPKIYRMLLSGINTGYIDEAKTLPLNAEVLLDKICLPMFIITAAMLTGRFLWRVCFFGAGIKAKTDLRNKMFFHAIGLSQNYYSTHKVGTMMSLFTHDVDTVEEAMGWGVMIFFDALLLGGLSAYNMIVVQPMLAVLCLIPMVLLLVIGIILNKYMTLRWDAREQTFSDISDFAQENFSGISVVKAFVKEAKELWAFKKLNVANENANVAFAKLSVALRISVMLFVESVVCIILGVGGYFVYLKTITVESLIEFIGYFMAIVWPVMAVSEFIDIHSRGKASLKRVTELFDAKCDVIDRKGAVDAGNVKGDIECRNLTFRYLFSEYDSLKNVSFKITAGENVGVVGRIGAGKTTLVDLIARLYNVPDGTLFIDGKDVNTLTIDSVRRNIAYVPQDNFLFSDTVARNVAFSAEEENEEDILNAAALAGVSGDIEKFKQKYNTVLGERGVTVSGGQKQRISIARALMKDAPILILDDSVSAVDTETEKLILSNLKKTRKGKTTILIAHRISTVEKMDKILFLSENGEVLGFDKPAELYDTCDEYRKMVELQKLEDKETA